MFIKLFFAFGAGFISFLTPCVLPIIPGYISYITGKNLDEIEQDKRNVLIKTILFSIGFSLVFIVLGATASAVGNILLFLSNELRIAAGILIVLFSLQMLGIFNFDFLNQEKRLETKSFRDNYAFPLLVGAAFAFGWTPCIGPQLASILTLAASEKTVSQGIVLLGVYALGLGLPFLIVALFLNRLSATIFWLKRQADVIERLMGLLLWTIGLMIITGGFKDFSFWILQNFPALAVLG